MLFSTNQENDQDDQKQQKNHPHPPRYAPPERQKRVVVDGRTVPVSHAVQTDSNPFPQTIQTGIITTIPQRQRHLVATI
jgi:uncharacterized protein (DUF427 family)